MTNEPTGIAWLNTMLAVTMILGNFDKARKFFRYLSDHKDEMDDEAERIFEYLMHEFKEDVEVMAFLLNINNELHIIDSDAVGLEL